MNEATRPIDEILGEALRQPEAERASYLDTACRADPVLRAELEALLTADAKASQAGFLAPPGHELNRPATVFAPLTERPGTVIGRYKLLQIIGEGGFGVVYLAEQREPVQRRVALKIIKLGMDTRQVIARFEAERQALALMDHPHIARVFDGGATDTGRPYFVMELVRGDPITQYCDTNNLSTEARLELFQQVCNAVQHAHQKGIIHRDIKPSNVLVTIADGKPIPKVIDFGIAKATSARLTEKTLFTEHRALIGTPEYMSPEQADMTGVDIDTRSDIYSLGVLLYELLTGTTPFEPQQLRSAAFGEIQRIIREIEPQKPSTRLSTMGEGLPSVAAHRHSEPARLTKSVRGDLDWIVMKCLEKDRTRRYETANGLAMDIQRHLSDEPVVAGPPSAGYRLRKFVKRNRAGVIAGSAIAAALVLGIVGTSFGLAWALHERDRANTQATRAMKAEGDTKDRAAELEQVAEFQAEQLSGIDVSLMAVRLRAGLIEKARTAAERSALDEQATAARIADLESALAGADLTGLSLSLLHENIFERALETIAKQFENQPLVQARLLQTVADTLVSLGLYDRATQPQEESLRIRRAELGEEHPDTVNSIGSVGVLLRSQGKLAEAEPYSREALEKSRRVLGDEHPGTLSAINNMGTLLRAQGERAEAEPYYREALEKRRRVLGDEHTDTLISINNLGLLLQYQGKFVEAELYYREALEKSRRVLGDDHPDTVVSISSMGFLLQIQGKFAECEPYYREALEKFRQVLGDQHPNTLSSIISMGNLLLPQGKLAEADPYYREALEKSRRVLGDDHPITLNAIIGMGSLLQSQGKLAEAEPYFREALETSRRVQGDEHPFTLTYINSLGGLLAQTAQFTDAVALLMPAQEAARKVFTDGHAHRLATFLMNLGRARAGLGDFASAETNFLEAQPIFLQSRGATHKNTRDCTQALIDLYDAWHAAEPGKGCDDKAVKWRAKLETLQTQ